jgi:hypothetical protein
MMHELFTGQVRPENLLAASTDVLAQVMRHCLLMQSTLQFCITQAVERSL